MYPNLKLQLWKSGIRQNRLARLVGVDETVLSRIVNGFREPSSELQNSIAELLKCDAEWLFDREIVSMAPDSRPPGDVQRDVSGRVPGDVPLDVPAASAGSHFPPMVEPESGQAE